MEISLQSRLILAAKAARPKAAEIEDAEGTENASSAQESKTDSFSATNPIVEKLQAQTERLKNLLDQTSEAAQPLSIPPVPWEASEESEDELDMLEKQMKTMKRCMEIARRIMRGDKVPPEDMEYLMENDPNGFKLAMAMRKTKKNPKEWESVLKDDQKSEASNESSGEEAAPAESCEASSEASGGGTSDTGGSSEE